MPIESPQLDDLGFDELEQLMRTQIPVYTPEWTDHNDSDPGITMIQLFAHLGEQIGVRLNRLPEKNYIEFLKLIGIRLAPAEPASTTMAIVLSSPENVEQFLIPIASKINAKSDADEPPVFETDDNLDVTPAQLAALITTRSDVLTRIQASGEAVPVGADPQEFIDERYSLAWDGKSPKLKDMPTEPVSLFHRPSETTHKYVWLGLAFNGSATAGFLGSRVTLHMRLDSDEQPVTEAHVICGEFDPELVDFSAPDDDLVSYQYYRPPQLSEGTGTWRDLNVIGDSTQGWTQSGDIRFDVPLKMGAIPDDEWQDVETEAPQPHPLIGSLKNPVRGAPEMVPASGWIRVEFKTVVPAATLRMISFNVVQATSAITVLNEQLGIGNGQADQQLQLLNDNILEGSLELVTVSTGLEQEKIPWTRVDSFDGIGPFRTVYVLDPESGAIGFGDKTTGVPPADTQRVIAERYRHGGGLDNDVAVGLVNKPDSLPPAVEAAINIVAATGGKNAETLDEAIKRAPSEMQSQERAVTVGDFEFHTMQTVGLHVGRAEVVTFHKPYPEGRRIPGTMIPKVGLDFDTHIPGVVSVIVVPKEAGLYPTPTKGRLHKVCRHLDAYRLITTEVYATVPQYVRIFDLDIQLRAESGYTRTQLREAISERLETYFHILTGGEDGEGFPFGGTIHHADFVAQIFRVAGIARVESFSAMFDGNTPDEAGNPMTWRSERLLPLRLVNCVDAEDDRDTIVLAPDENVFIDSSSVNVRFFGD